MHAIAKSIKRATAIGAVAIIVSACSAPAATPGASPDGTSQAPTASSGAASGALTNVKIGYGAIAPSIVPLWVAKEIGAFERYGIDADLIFVEGGQRTAVGLLSGATQFSFFGGAEFLSPFAEGADIVALASMGDRLTDVIIGGEGIATPEDLEDGAVAANQPGGETDLATRYALEQIGLVPDQNVRVLAVGGESTRVAALLGGSVQAAIMDFRFIPEMEAQGFTTLFSFLDSDLPYQKEMMVTTGSYLEANRGTVEAVVKALLEGIRYYQEHREEAISIAATYEATTDLGPLALAYDELAPKFPFPPRVTDEGFETVQGWSEDPAVKELDVTTLYDNSVIDDLEDSGFITDLSSP